MGESSADRRLVGQRIVEALHTPKGQVVNRLVTGAHHTSRMGKHRELADAVEASIASFEHLVMPETPGDPATLSKARVILVQAVNAYIGDLDHRLAGRKADPTLARWHEAHREVVTLRKFYSEHIGRYNAAVIASDWAGYRASCLGLSNAMKSHLREVAAFPALG